MEIGEMYNEWRKVNYSSKKGQKMVLKEPKKTKKGKKCLRKVQKYHEIGSKFVWKRPENEQNQCKKKPCVMISTIFFTNLKVSIWTKIKLGQILSNLVYFSYSFMALFDMIHKLWLTIKRTNKRDQERSLW